MFDEKNTKIDKKVDTKVSNKVEIVEKSIFDLLDIEEIENEKAFLSHTIEAKIDGYRITNDVHDRPIKVQFQNKSIDENSGALVDFTFTLSADVGIIKESDIKDLVGKIIKVSDVIRYVDVNRNNMGQEISRQYRYGGEWGNMVVVPNSKVENNEVNSYVEINLTSVSNVMKKNKPVGDVKLISIKKVNDGSVKTFEIKLKHNGEINRKLEKDMFKPILGKKIRINGIKDSRINGKTFYSTEKMPVLV